MRTMKILLSSSEEGKVAIHVIGSPRGETGAFQAVDFTELIERRSVLLKSLSAVAFHQDDFPDKEEVDWMKRKGLLNDDGDNFHRDLYKKIGSMFYEQLFPKDTEVRDLLHSALAITSSRQELLHIQLQIESGIGKYVQVFDFPWELLCDKSGFLANGRADFSRYIAHDIPVSRLPRNKDVNLLLVSSKAYDMKNGLGEISSNEADLIHACLAPGAAQSGRPGGRIHLEMLAQASFDKFGQYLTTHRGSSTPHIIHFDGHGFFGKQCRKCNNEVHRMFDDRCRSCGKEDFSEPQGYLLFEHDDQRVEYVSAKRLATEIHAANLIRSNAAATQDHIALVVLSACRSAVSLFRDSIFNGVAQSLIYAGISAVVAMQFSVTIPSAAKFVERFYMSLSEKDMIDMAMNSGRGVMDYEKDQWYRPVLYQRWQDDQGGQLFTDTELIVEQSPTMRDFRPEFETSNSFFETVSLLYRPITEKLKESEERRGKYILPKAHRAFFSAGIGPASCKKAYDELQELKLPVQYLVEFIDSDKATVLNLSSIEVQLRNSIRQQIHDSYTILYDLEPLIEKFIPLSKDQSKDMRRSLQEIQKFLRELEEHFNTIKDIVNSFS